MLKQLDFIDLNKISSTVINFLKSNESSIVYPIYINFFN